MKNALSLLVVPFLALGCGGFGAGDYALYRIATSDASLSASCGTAPDDGDSNTLRDGSTVMIYFYGAEAGVVPYLDLGETVLEGTETDEGYEFRGNVVDVDDQGTTKFTTKIDIKVSMTIDGATANLTSVSTTELSCSGECTGFDPFSCTATATAVGVQVDQAVSVPIENNQANP